MKLFVRSLLWLSGAFCFAMPLHSQVFENDAGKREKLFVYRVKQIDEFFERFNNDTSSFIRKLYASRGVKFKIDRPALIRSLFNYQSKTWQAPLVDSFVKSAMNVRMPSGANFYGEGWYAEVICRFKYRDTIDIPLILEINTDQYHRSKWSIAGVKQTLFKSAPDPANFLKTTRTDKFISPVSHTNYFIELEKDLDDKENLASYFTGSFFNSPYANGFYNAILKNQIKFLHVREIRFHFLQVNNFIFTVQNFERETLNSGWLINNLKAASAADKKHFRKELLGEQ